MIFEVVGISPKNKGALLMLDAVCEQIRARYPDAKICIPLPWPIELRMERKLLASVPASGRSTARLLSAIPLTLRHEIGVVSRSEVDVVLDASGFAYGDYWGRKTFQRRLFSRFNTKKIIILPQAVGPFRSSKMAAYWTKVVKRADLIFLRDGTSASYARSAFNEGTNVSIAPDFTNLLRPGLPACYMQHSGKALLIPNRKMVNEETSLDQYLKFLAAAVEKVRERKKDVIALIHEGENDRKIITQLNEILPAPLEVVEIDSALTTKALIANSDLIIASRFHAIVSALSSGVPALAAGWSHKYYELLNDYGCTKHLVDMANPASWSDAIDGFLSDAESSVFRGQLEQASNEQKNRTHAMWNKVFSVIEQL